MQEESRELITDRFSDCRSPIYDSADIRDSKSISKDEFINAPN